MHLSCHASSVACPLTKTKTKTRKPGKLTLFTEKPVILTPSPPYRTITRRLLENSPCISAIGTLLNRLKWEPRQSIA